MIRRTFAGILGVLALSLSGPAAHASPVATVSSGFMQVEFEARSYNGYWTLAILENDGAPGVTGNFSFEGAAPTDATRTITLSAALDCFGRTVDAATGNQIFRFRAFDFVKSQGSSFPIYGVANLGAHSEFGVMELTAFDSCGGGEIESQLNGVGFMTVFTHTP